MNLLAQRTPLISHLFAIISILATVVFVTIRFWYWDFDDGFIVYRYVENLIAGKGWVYNEGEAYNASTSVLNTLMIATVALTGIGIREAAHVVGALGLSALGLGVYFFLLRDGLSLMGAAAAIVIVYLMGNNFTWGLESNLFFGTLSAFLGLFVHGIRVWWLLGFLILVRPDGIIFASLVVVLSAWQRTLTLRALVQIVLPVVPWAIYSMWAFGAVFPATLQQKVWQGRSGYWGTGPIFIKGLINYLRGDAWQHVAGSHWAPLVLSAPLLFMPQGIAEMVRRRSWPAGLVVAYVIVMLGCYSFLNVPNYHWYYVGIVFAGYVAAWYGIRFVFPRVFRGIWPVSASLVLFFTSVLGVRLTERLWNRYQDPAAHFRDVRTEVYRQLSERIVAKTPNSTSIAAVEVGVVGFFSRRPMIDLVGLTTPYGEFITGVSNSVLYDQLKPGTIIFHEPLMPHEEAVFADTRLSEHYQYGGDIVFSGYPRLLFYVRNPSSLNSFTQAIADFKVVHSNDVVQVGQATYKVTGEDPWLELAIPNPIGVLAPRFEIDYELASLGRSPQELLRSRIYFASESGEAFNQDRSVPLQLSVGARKQARYLLALQRGDGTKTMNIHKVRFDLVENRKKDDDITLVLHKAMLSDIVSTQ
jgi:arabinofuranosyltransferase